MGAERVGIVGTYVECIWPNRAPVSLEDYGSRGRESIKE